MSKILDQIVLRYISKTAAFPPPKKPGDTVQLWQHRQDRNGKHIEPGKYTILKTEMHFTMAGPDPFVPFYTIDIPQNNSQFTEAYFWFDHYKIPEHHRDNMEIMTRILLSALKKAGITDVKRESSIRRDGRKLSVPYGKVGPAFNQVKQALAVRPEIETKSWNTLIGTMQSGEHKFDHYEITLYPSGTSWSEEGPFSYLEMYWTQ